MYGKLSLVTVIGLASFFIQFKNPEAYFNEPTLVKKWETDSLLKTPESVLFDESKNILYISNINGQPLEKDGNGFISKVSIDGKIEKLEWVKGMDAPKGMGLFKKKLYVTDISKVVVIDTESGEIVQTIEVGGAKFLNDISIDQKGVVYITDSETNTVHKMENNKVSVLVKDPSLKTPNGLLATPEQLYLVDMGTGVFYGMNYKDFKLNKKAEGATMGDGIVMIGKNQFLISNWGGEVNYVNEKGQVKKILDTKAEKFNAADIEYSSKSNLLFVPTFWKNSIVAYEVKR